MLVTFDTAITGLTVGYKILNADKSQYAARATAGITDLGGGTYAVTVADATLAGRTVVWDTGESVPRYGSETFPSDAKLDDVLEKTNTIGSLAVTVTSPVAAGGVITIEQGDSYPAGRNRPIDINVDDPTHAKGLDAANTTLYLLATQFTWTAASVTETVPGYLVRFEPSIAQTSAVTASRQSYKLKAAIDNVDPASDDAETIVRGTVVMNRDIPAVGAP